MDGREKGSFFFVKLGDLFRQQPCFCGSSLGHGRTAPPLPNRLEAASVKVIMLFLKGGKLVLL